MSAFLHIHPCEVNLVVLDNLADGLVETPIDIAGLLCGCFHEGASQVFCQVTTLCIINQLVYVCLVGTREIAWSVS